MTKAKDVMNERCQARHGFKVEGLLTSPNASFEARYSKPHGQQDYDAFEERLADNAVTPVPEQVASRVDFPQWRAGWSERDRRLIDLLILDTHTQDAARTFGVSPGRVSQKRLEFHADWHRFQGEGATQATHGTRVECGRSLVRGRWSQDRNPDNSNGLGSNLMARVP